MFSNRYIFKYINFNNEQLKTILFLDTQNVKAIKTRYAMSLSDIGINKN